MLRLTVLMSITHRIYLVFHASKRNFLQIHYHKEKQRNYKFSSIILFTRYFLHEEKLSDTQKIIVWPLFQAPRIVVGCKSFRTILFPQRLYILSNRSSNYSVQTILFINYYVELNYLRSLNSPPFCFFHPRLFV